MTPASVWRWVYLPLSIQTLLSILRSARCTCATPARWAAATPTSSGKIVAWRERRTCRAPASREHSNSVGGGVLCLGLRRWDNVNGFADMCMTPLSGLAPIA